MIRRPMLAALALCCGLSLQASALPKPRVLLITLDGFPAYLLEDPKASLPALRALAKRGVVSEGMTVVNPSVTWPNHTTLVTGVRPARHSVMFNGVLVRGQPGEVVRVEPGHDQTELIAAPTVFDLLHEAGVSTAGINWPCTRNASSLDVNFPDVPEQVKYMTAPLRDELVADGVLPAGGDAAFRQLSAPAHDEIWCAAACRTIRKNKPEFMLLHLLNLDGAHHKYGPQTPAGYTAAALLDAQVRQVLDAIEAAGLTAETTVFVVADHGFKTSTRVLLPNVLLKQASLLKAGPAGILSARVQAISEGGVAMIYLNNPETAADDRVDVARLFAGREGVAAVITPEQYATIGLPLPKENRQSPDLVITAADGYAFDGSTSGEEFVIPAVFGRHFMGNHGYPGDDAKMRAVFIAAGPGIRVGARIGVINNVDVAPTIAAIFGREMTEVDGKPLTALFTAK